MVLVFLSGEQGLVPRGLLFDDHDRLVGHGRDGTWPGYGKDLCDMNLALVTAENAMERRKEISGYRGMGRLSGTKWFCWAAKGSSGLGRLSGFFWRPCRESTSWLLLTVIVEGKVS